MGDAISGVAGALDSFGRALVGWVVQQNFSTALLLVGALALDRALARRARASLRVALYAPVALRVLLPLDWNLRIPSAPPVETIFAPLLVGARSALDATPSSTLSWYALAAGLYIIGAILLAARAIFARVRLGRALVQASPVVGLDFHLGCAVMQHADLGPIAVGVLTPRIVVPRELLGKQNEHALACVLRHEVAHLYRRDTWLSAAMLFLGIAAWPVIPVWIAIARVRQLVELACDENALEGADASERRRYGHVLLDIAESRSSAIASMGAGGLYFGSTLRARVEALAMQRHWPLGAQALALSLAPIVLFLACGGSAAPPVFGHVTTYGYEFAPVTPGQAPRAPAQDIARTTNPAGRLVPEAIENVVLGNSAAISSCYDARYGTNARPTGAVTVRYVIGEDGVTNDAFDDGSTLPDHAVVDCVVGVFRNLNYPASRDGKIAVIYPIQFGS
jgi:beta-lactamase regulating signal transducer with metallopeptidase domain